MEQRANSVVSAIGLTSFLRMPTYHRDLKSWVSQSVSKSNAEQSPATPILHCKPRSLNPKQATLSFTQANDQRLIS